VLELELLGDKLELELDGVLELEDELELLGCMPDLKFTGEANICSGCSFGMLIFASALFAISILPYFLSSVG
jgi:hypothetical protein